MVTIINVKQVETEKGVFTSLEIQSDIQFAKSEATGNYYLTANKMRISTSLPLEFCKSLIGQRLPGTIERVACAPYRYQNKETGELMTLNHTYAYVPQEAMVSQPVNTYIDTPYVGQPQFQQSQNVIPSMSADIMNGMGLGMVAEA